MPKYRNTIAKFGDTTTVHEAESKETLAHMFLDRFREMAREDWNNWGWDEMPEAWRTGFLVMRVDKYHAEFIAGLVEVQDTTKLEQVEQWAVFEATSIPSKRIGAKDHVVMVERSEALTAFAIDIAEAEQRGYQQGLADGRLVGQIDGKIAAIRAGDRATIQPYKGVTYDGIDNSAEALRQWEAEVDRYGSPPWAEAQGIEGKKVRAKMWAKHLYVESRHGKGWFWCDGNPWTTPSRSGYNGEWELWEERT